MVPESEPLYFWDRFLAAAHEMCWTLEKICRAQEMLYVLYVDCIKVLLYTLQLWSKRAEDESHNKVYEIRVNSHFFTYTVLNECPLLSRALPAATILQNNSTAENKKYVSRKKQRIIIVFFSRDSCQDFK